IGTVDTVGTSGLPPLVLSTIELQQLAALYPVGQTLWRTPITHFTAIDGNYGYFAPGDAGTAPNSGDPKRKPDENCSARASIIECQSQVLGETIRLTGTPFSLNYRSDRVPGRQAADMLTILLSGATGTGDALCPPPPARGPPAAGEPQAHRSRDHGGGPDVYTVLPAHDQPSHDVHLGWHGCLWPWDAGVAACHGPSGLHLRRGIP